MDGEQRGKEHEGRSTAGDGGSGGLSSALAAVVDRLREKEAAFPGLLIKMHL